MTSESIGEGSAFLESFVDRSDYLSWLDIDVESIEHESATVHLPASEKLYNPAQGTSSAISGGIVSTLIDIAGGFAIWTTLDDAEGTQLSTTDMNVSYVRPATDDLTADAEVVNVGDALGVAEVAVESTDDDRVVATGRTTYHVG